MLQLVQLLLSDHCNLSFSRNNPSTEKEVPIISNWRIWFCYLCWLFCWSWSWYKLSLVSSGSRSSCIGSGSSRLISPIVLEISCKLRPRRQSNAVLCSCEAPVSSWSEVQGGSLLSRRWKIGCRRSCWWGADTTHIIVLGTAEVTVTSGYSSGTFAGTCSHCGGGGRWRGRRWSWSVLGKTFSTNVIVLATAWITVSRGNCLLTFPRTLTNSCCCGWGWCWVDGETFSTNVNVGITTWVTVSWPYGILELV